METPRIPKLEDTPKEESEKIFHFELEETQRVIEEERLRLEQKVEEVMENTIERNSSPHSYILNEIDQKITKKKSELIDKLRKFSKAAVLGTALLISDTPDQPAESSWKARRDRAETELATKGITREQRKAYVTGFNDLLYKSIVPRAYSVYRHDANYQPIPDQSLVNNLITSSNRMIKGLGGRFIEEPQREDAWRLYLGLSQQNNTFGISEYVPTRSGEDKYYYKLNNPNILLKGYGPIPEIINRIINTIEVTSQKTALLNDYYVLGHYTWTRGTDEKGSYIAYYDKWNLDIPVERNGLFGQPLEIYDRIYYDPKTFELIP